MISIFSDSNYEKAKALDLAQHDVEYMLALDENDTPKLRVTFFHPEKETAKAFVPNSMKPGHAAIKRALKLIEEERQQVVMP